MSINTLQKRLKNHEKIVLTGPTGTEILRRGYDTTLPLWSAEILLTNPKVIQKIHEDYIKAGAEIIVTNTFRTTSRAFAKRNLSAKKAKEITILACKLAKKAIKKINVKYSVYIAGSVAPLEDCYSPELTPSDKQLIKEHLEYVKNLKAGGVDFLLIETQITIKEIIAALKAAKKVGLPAAVSFCVDKKTNLLGGEKIEEAVKKIEKYKPIFIGVNCVSPEVATKTLKKLKELTTIPLSVYAQGEGGPDDDQGWKFQEEKKKKYYLGFIPKWEKIGAQIIGGCCGTNPEYIKEIKNIL